MASSDRRVRFYGTGDLATHWQVEDAAAIFEGYPPDTFLGTVADFIELHNAQQFVEADFLPASYTDAQRKRVKATASRVRGDVAKFFTGIDETNVEDLVAGVEFDYHGDLLDLLGRYHAFERCGANVMLRALKSTGVRLNTMLSNKRLVHAYDTPLREDLLSDARAAEFLIRKYFDKDTRVETHLPGSLTPLDAHAILERYVDSDDPNLNYLRLIETAPIATRTGVDAKLKLRVKRKKDVVSAEFFKDNTGVKSGCEIGISDDQDEPVISRMDGLVAIYTYSAGWLGKTTDHPSILNNFQHLFEFADRTAMLTLPSYPAELGAMEGLFGATGRHDYKIGAAYRIKDMSSTLQLRIFEHFLASKGIELESVIAWFFQDYLREEFDAQMFSFAASDGSSTYLQRTRHLFAEMESVVRQFGLFVKEGEIDRDLLAITSDAVGYKHIPSLLDGKYVYPIENSEIAGVLNALFSDQTSLGYISEDLNAPTASELLLHNHISYSDFKNHQRPSIDYLIGLEILRNTGDRVVITSAEQFLILRSLFTSQAASYFHLSADGRSVVDSMVSKGWLRRESTLLANAEASYFNFQLNKTEFSNGPELRNKYLHGSQASTEGDIAHYDAYITALKLLVNLVIKLNDDFCLHAANFDSAAKVRAPK